LALAADPAVGLASQPLMTLGDVFQALFTADTAGAQATMEAMTAIVELARPTAVRFGVGIGPLISGLRLWKPESGEIRLLAEGSHWLVAVSDRYILTKGRTRWRHESST
jgi:hypothetical protein